jgi:ankyrin repeat protein
VNETAANGASPLQLAVGGGHFELAADLLKRGADPSVGGMGWTVLHDIAFVRRPNVSYNNPGPLPTGHMDSLVLLKELVEHGADPNARATVDAMPLMFVGRSVANYKGATAFWAASLRGDVALMKALVELGADPLLPNEDGTTPLMAAAGVGLWGVLETPGTAEESLEAVKFCLAHGGSATTVDANGDTAVHGAVLRRAMGTLEVLVGAGAPLNVRNKENVPCAGCNAGVKGTGGWTPWRMAAGVYYAGAIRVDPDIAAYLERLLKERGLPVE